MAGDEPAITSGDDDEQVGREPQLNRRVGRGPHRDALERDHAHASTTAHIAPCCHGCTGNSRTTTSVPSVATPMATPAAREGPSDT